MDKSKSAKPVYHEYLNLSPKERRSLLLTNWFRYKHKIPLIEVPPSETNYHKQFAKLLSDKK